MVYKYYYHFIFQDNLKDWPLIIIEATKAYTSELKQNKAPNEEISKAHYEVLAKHVKLEKERIGGQNWVLSQAVTSRKHRDLIKTILGPKCIFVTLTLSPETRNQRLQKRYAHLEQEKRLWTLEFLTNVEKNFEPAAFDEENAQNIMITPELDQLAVVQKILEVYKSFE